MGVTHTAQADDLDGPAAVFHIKDSTDYEVGFLDRRELPPEERRDPAVVAEKLFFVDTHYLESDRGLPGDIFTSPEVFQAELSYLVSKIWACTGITSDVGSVGDVHPFTFAGQPLLLTRADDGRIRADRV